MSVFSRGSLTTSIVFLGRDLLVCGALACLAGCNAPLMGPGHMGPAVMTYGGSTPLSPPAGHGIALLAPMTGKDAAVGPALVDATRLGLGTGPVPPVAIFDTGSTPAGAASGARQAMTQGAGVILGPLTDAETSAVSPFTTAAHVDVLAFTSDNTVAKPGLWTLGITPVEQVKALLRVARASGHGEVAGLLPLTPQGEAMAQALRTLEPTAPIEFYGDSPAMKAAARILSDYADRRGPIDARIKVLQAEHTAEASAEASRIARQPVPPPPFNALLIAETGAALSDLANLLMFYDVAPGPVLILGPSLWAEDPASVAAAGLSGALYAAPDPVAAADFTWRYELQFGSRPPVQASLAFDAGAIARSATETGVLDLGALTVPSGFGGADGVLALQPDGSVRRGLAVFRVQLDGAQIVRPAPAALPAPLL